MNQLRPRLLILLAFIATISSQLANGQTGTLRGFVYEEESGEPIIFTNVVIQGTTLGISTDVNGYFSIGDIPAGEQVVEVSYLGFEKAEKTVSIIENRIITTKIFLKKSSIEINTIEISAEKQDARTNVNMSVTKVTPREIKQLPSIGGTPDLAQYLQVVPGIIFTGDQGGQLYIRGGSPVQNKVLLDGMTIYNPFHSIGLFSVFETELIRNADVYTAGFGAEYGGRVSSIMDVTMRDGNKRRLSGKIGASTFAANAYIEGPLQKQTNEGKSSSSFVFSAKHSYLDQTSQNLYDYVSDDGLPFSFTDLYGKVSFNANTGSKFSLFGFSFNDATTFRRTSELDWTAFGGGLNFVLVPQGSAVLVEGHFNISDYEINLIEKATIDEFPEPRTSGINNFNLGLDFKYFNGDNEFKYGIDVTGFGTDFTYFNTTGQRLSQNSNSTELAGFAAYKFNLNNLVLDLGMRAQYYSTLRVLRPEPRVGAKYNITPKFRIKTAAGLYSQNLVSANSDRDVVNLFYGFLVAPEDIQDEFTTEDGDVREVTNPLQTSYHVLAGFEYDLTENLSANVEGYLKNFTQVTNINRNKVFASNDIAAPDILKNDFIIESGTARGIDFTLKYEANKIYVWAVYSLSDVDRWDGVRTYDPVFDRRHNVNLLVSYRWGKVKDWEASARWNYGSGFPFTQNQGFYLSETLAGDVNTDITETNSDDVTIQYAGLNQGRLPDYHRMDFTLKKTFFFSEYSSLEASFSLTNIYDRNNIFYVDRFSGEEVYQLPLLPSVGLLFSF